MTYPVVLTIEIVLGIVLLFFGRKVFWLIVATLGFVAGTLIAQQFFADRTEGTILIFALAAGVLGALLALLLQRVAIGVAGFAGGGYLTIRLIYGWAPETVQFPWLPFIVGGVIGAILMSVLFEWALIILSSFIGAALIVRVLQLPDPMAVPVLVFLSVVGMIVQAKFKHKKQPKPSEKE